MEMTRLYAELEVIDAYNEELVLAITKSSRETLIEARTWLSILQDLVRDDNTKINIGEVKNEIYDMLYKKE